jgi:GTP-binding protein EngB required for normal cell division
LGEKVTALREAAGFAAGRSPETAVAEALRVCRQVDHRLAFSGDECVIALAGATGSGKSSLFNALTGTQLAITGVRRPTTSQAMAAVWGPKVPHELLDWLEVPVRQHLNDTDPQLSGLVLLDLPDHDSRATSHVVEVDRLVKLVDGFVWVLDPQKYADKALHDNYLKRLAPYADVMVFVLNQSDRLTPEQAKEAVADLRELLNKDGLAKARIISTSALDGTGVGQLRTLVAGLASTKAMTASRLLHDVEKASIGLAGDLNRNRQRKVSPAHQARLETALAASAGVDAVVDAVRESTRLRGTVATGWPIISWIGNFRIDPLKKLRLNVLGGSEAGSAGDGARASGVAALAASSNDASARLGTSATPARLGAVAGSPSLATPRTTLQASPVQRAQVSSALRDLSDDVSSGLTDGWVNAIRQASLSHEDTLASELDVAVATTDLGVKPFGWWRFVRIIQWTLIAGAVLGLLWLSSGPAFEFFKLDPPPLYEWRGRPLPTVIVFASLALGLLLGLLCRVGVRASAARRAAGARAALMRSIGLAADASVLIPVNTELERYARFVASLARALP